MNAIRRVSRASEHRSTGKWRGLPNGQRFLRPSRGLSTLFFTEMWERFSYYGMRAILILFMTAKVSRRRYGLDTADAGVIYGLTTAMVYMAALPGGWIADQFLGFGRLFSLAEF